MFGNALEAELDSVHEKTASLTQARRQSILDRWLDERTEEDKQAELEELSKPATRSKKYKR